MRWHARRWATPAGVVALTGLVLFPAEPASAAEAAACRDYADQTRAQVTLARQNDCRGLEGNSWSEDGNLHYLWCLTVEEAVLQVELDKRDRALRDCGVQVEAFPQQPTMQMQTGIRAVEPPPRAAPPADRSSDLAPAPPRIAPLSDGVRPLDNVGRVSRLETLPIAPSAHYEDYPRVGKNAIVCVLKNISPTEKAVRISVEGYGSRLQSEAFRVPSREIVSVVHDRRSPGYATSGEVSCVFEVEGTSSSYRAGAVVYGAGNPTSHPAY